MKKEEYGLLIRTFRERILEELGDSRDITDSFLTEVIDRVIAEENAGRYLSLSERLELRRRLFDSFKRLDILQTLLDDSSITEIMINGPRKIFIEQNGQIRRWNGEFESEEKLEDIIQQIVSRINRRVNTASPIVDARLRDGSRVHVVLPPVAVSGPTVTIRKFPEPITIEKLISRRSLTREASGYLRALVEAGCNIFISGGTSSGKTTFLNALSSFIPSRERVITIEDSAELQITHIPNLVSLETRDANTEGKGCIDMSQLIKAALRMRPDRIIVGEVRDRSAIDMINALNTGHDGSLSTGHANSTGDMLTRLESMMLSGMEIPLPALRQQIAAAIDILVHLEREKDGSRRVAEISEIDGCAGGEILLNPIFRLDRKSGELIRVGDLKHREKPDRRGVKLPCSCCGTSESGSDE